MNRCRPFMSFQRCFTRTQTYMVMCSWLICAFFFFVWRHRWCYSLQEFFRVIGVFRPYLRIKRRLRVERTTIVITDSYELPSRLICNFTNLAQVMTWEGLNAKWPLSPRRLPPPPEGLIWLWPGVILTLTKQKVYHSTRLDKRKCMMVFVFLFCGPC